jgi:hypothetical protein
VADRIDLRTFKLCITGATSVKVRAVKQRKQDVNG